MRRAGLVVAEALAAVRERAAPGVTTGAARRGRRRGHRRPRTRRRRSSATTGTRRRSASRSTTRSCTASRAPGCWSRVTWCRSTAARSSTGWHGDSAITVVLDGAAPEDVDLAATTERRHVGRHRRAGRRRAAGRRGGGGRGRRRRRRGGRPERRRAVRPRRGVRRARDRHVDAPAAGRAELPQPRPRPAGAPGSVRRGRADGRPWAAVHRRSSTTTGRSSRDGSRASHWEHTVAVLEDGIWVLTAVDGGAEELGRARRRGDACSPDGPPASEPALGAGLSPVADATVAGFLERP